MPKPQDRKANIVAIAARLFREKGYSAVTMRDIAHELEIRAASLYNHIRSKQQILELIIIEIAEEYTATIKEIEASDISTKEKLARVIELHIDITVRNPDALASLNNDWMHLPEPGLKYFLQMREEYEAIFRKIVNEGIQRGEIKGRNAEVIIFAILSTIRTLYVWYGKRPKFNEKTIRAHLSNVLLDGIF